jgi:glutathione synthase/RimK-type ligase-like ATP-grasp enzyme
MALDPIDVYYEHPDWFRPLFTRLEQRGIPFRRLNAASHVFDPTRASDSGLFVNRMSPSAWTRGCGAAIPYTLDYLRHLEWSGTPVFNGRHSFLLETSKAAQLSLLASLGLPVPRTRVLNDVALLAETAPELTFPLIVKPNVGGSGAGILLLEDEASLLLAVDEDRILTGPDGIILLQEYHRPVENRIVRLETLEGAYLYGIRVHLGEGAGFNLCPADACATTDGRALSSEACPVGAQKAGLRVERFEPPAEIRRAVEAIAREARLDVGGIEYLESARDGRTYFYDINALSNFVADPIEVLGFDPTERLVDALWARASGGRA